MLTTDYLIVGSGANGMIFADQLLSETDAEILIVDRHHMPGGHWNDAYSFVRLHQPSAFSSLTQRCLRRTRPPSRSLQMSSWPPPICCPRWRRDTNASAS